VWDQPVATVLRVTSVEQLHKKKIAQGAMLALPCLVFKLNSLFPLCFPSS
jgi:hypothetical protein